MQCYRSGKQPATKPVCTCFSTRTCNSVELLQVKLQTLFSIWKNCERLISVELQDKICTLNVSDTHTTKTTRTEEALQHLESRLTYRSDFMVFIKTFILNLVITLKILLTNSQSSNRKIECALQLTKNKCGMCFCGLPCTL